VSRLWWRCHDWRALQEARTLSVSWLRTSEQLVTKSTQAPQRNRF
jgi:hypothetical protein